MQSDNHLKQILDLIKGMIEKHKTEYDLRKDININYLAFLVMQVQIGIYDFLEIYKGVDFRDNILNKKPMFSVSEEELIEIISSFAELLKNGMAREE